MKVFLSHNSDDKPFVKSLDRFLNRRGIPTFLDERDILFGDDIPHRLYYELDQATHFIYIISKKSINAPWVKEELSIAKVREKEKNKITIIPVLIEDLKLPRSIKHIKYVDFRTQRWGVRTRSKIAQSLLYQLRASVEGPKEQLAIMPPEMESINREIKLLSDLANKFTKLRVEGLGYLYSSTGKTIGNLSVGLTIKMFTGKYFEAHSNIIFPNMPSIGLPNDLRHLDRTERGITADIWLGTSIINRAHNHLVKFHKELKKTRLKKIAEIDHYNLLRRMAYELDILSFTCRALVDLYIFLAEKYSQPLKMKGNYLPNQRVEPTS